MAARTVEAITRARRRGRVVELRRIGLPFFMIADKIQEEFDRPRYTAADAYADLQAVLKQTIEQTTQSVDAWRVQEVDRLDLAQTAIWTRVLRGELPAIDRLLKIIELRAKLTGSFAPVKLAGPDGGPLQVDLVAKVAVEAIVGVVDRLNLPIEQRTAAIEDVRQAFAAIEAPDERAS